MQGLNGCPVRQWDQQGQQPGQGGAAFPGANHSSQAPCSPIPHPAFLVTARLLHRVSSLAPAFALLVKHRRFEYRTHTITMVSETYTPRILPLPARVGLWLCGRDERERPTSSSHRTAPPASGALHLSLHLPCCPPSRTNPFEETGSDHRTEWLLTTPTRRLPPTTRRRSRSLTPVATAAWSSTSLAISSAPAAKTRPSPRFAIWRRALAVNVSNLQCLGCGLLMISAANICEHSRFRDLPARPKPAGRLPRPRRARGVLPRVPGV